jgi:hypothetical protein
MAADHPIVSVQEWLDLLGLYASGCIQPGPDRHIQGEVAAYNTARRLLVGEPIPRPSLADRITARVFMWLFPEAEAEIEP